MTYSGPVEHRGKSTIGELFCFRIPISNTTAELIGDGEADHAQCHLVIGLNGDYVVADRLRLFGLVQALADTVHRGSGNDVNAFHAKDLLK